MKKRIKKGIPGRAARVLYLPLIGLLVSGCSYYDGKFIYFDFTDDNRKSLAATHATEKFWASIRPKTNLSDAHYRLGLHYQQSGEYDKAIGEFTKALRNDRGFCKAYNGIAMTYDIQKHCEQARASYEEALKCAPGEAYLYNNYACSSLLCGDYGKGLELLQKAESLAANEIRITNNLKIAQNIAVRENISEYLTTGETTLPAADKEKKPVISLPVQEGTPEVSLAKALDPEPAEESSLSAASIMAPHDQATDNREPSIIETPEIAGPKNPATPPEAVAADNPVIQTMAAQAPVLSLPVPANVAIEVSNGNGTTGMAKRSAEFLRGLGFTVRSITNARHFRFEETVIYYKAEYMQAAKDLAAVIPGTPNLQRVGTLEKSSIGVKVLLGRDLAATQFPESYVGSTDNRQTGLFRSAILSASNIQVRY